MNLMTVFLVFAAVVWMATGLCPILALGSPDIRSIGCFDLYNYEDDGVLNFALEFLAGRMSKEECIGYCSCEGYNFAANNISQGYCYCGSEMPSTCGPNCTVCITIFNLTGLVAPTLMVPSQVALFEPVKIQVASSLTVEKFAFKYGQRHFCCATDEITTAFAAAGNISLFAMNDDFFGCSSTGYKIEVYPATKLMLACPEFVPGAMPFNCTVILSSGREWTTLTWLQDGQPISTLTNLKSPVLYEVGAAMDYHPSTVFNQSFNQSLLEQKAFINLNQVFKAYGHLQGFEVHASRPGRLQFLVLKPLCFDDSTYFCEALRSCIPATSPCGNNSFASPAFCASTEEYYSQTLGSCPIRRELSTPVADYEVVYMQEVNATYTGNNVFSVDKEVVIQPGYILGWIPSYENPADLGSYKLNPVEEFHVFAYPDIFESTIGGRFPRSLVNASVTTLAHMVRAHVSTAQKFEPLTFSGNAAGRRVTVSASVSGIPSLTESVSTDVTFEMYISKATPLLDRSTILEGQSVLLMLSAINSIGITIRDPTFCVHWGLDDFTGTCDLVTMNDSVSYTYNMSGAYSIFVRAYNNVSSARAYLILTVYSADLISFNWINESRILPVATSTNMAAALTANGSGNYSLVYSLGDVAPVTINVALSKVFVFYVEHTFTEPTTAYCAFNLSQPFMSRYAAAYSLTQNVTDPPSVEPFDPVATNDSVSIRPAPNKGTNITYAWHWGDGGVDFSYELEVVNHTYKQYGNWTVFVNNSNLVSNNSSRFFVPVHDKVGDVFFSNPRLRVKIGSVMIVSVFIIQGTGMNVTFDYGDETSPETAVDVDQAGIMIFSKARHTYRDLGYYNLTITARNPVSLQTIWQLVPVEDPIADFNVVCFQEVEGYIEVGENLTCNMTFARGTNVLFNISFGDGSAAKVTSNFTVQHTYWMYNTTPGFVAKFTAFNNVSEVSTSVIFDVQRPVSNITGLRVWSYPGNWTDFIKIYYNMSSGNLFFCFWKTNDGTRTVLFTNYTSFNSTPYVQHRFQPGTYFVEVNCSNRLYSAVASGAVFSLKPVSRFDISSTYDCGKGLEKAKGFYENTLPMDCNVTFTILNQEGTNVSYFFNFGYKDVRGTEVKRYVYLENLVVHMFVFPGTPLMREVTATILANNSVSNRVEQLKLILHQRVLNVTLTSIKPVLAGAPSNFTWAAEQLGYQTCFRINWGDSSKGLVFGYTGCRDKANYKLDQYSADLIPLPGFGPPISRISHVYKTIGSVMVRITAENLVSTSSDMLWVRIEDKPCFKPTLLWTSAMGLTPNQTSAAPFKRCLSYLVTQKTIINCEKTNVKNQSWSLERVDIITDLNQESRVEVLEVIELTTDDSVLEIPTRWLDFGSYRLTFNVCMSGVPDTCNAIDGYFSVSSCDLEPKIFGGSGRAVAWNQTVIINGSLSSDPDSENPKNRSGLSFTWYCKHQDEEWPPDLNSLPEISEPETNNTNITPDKTTNFGCYGYGIGYLNDTYEGGTVLQLNTFYMMMYATYDIMFVMAQPNTSRPTRSLPYELTVMSTLEPPLITIVCKQNCDKKQIINSKISLIATCDNYPDDVLSFNWSMSSVEEDARSPTPTDQTWLLSSCLSTKLDGINLVIKPYCLQTGYIYTVRIRASVKNSRLFGFSLYTLIINQPPQKLSSGGCLVNPSEGDMLEKVFEIKCNGFDDDDLPLTYNFYYVQDDKEVKIIGAASPASGLFELGLNVSTLFVVVTDVYGADSEKVVMAVKVKRKTIKAEELSNKIEKLDVSNPEEAGPVLMTVLATAASSSAESSNKVAEMIINSIAQMEPKTPDACMMISGVANSATSGASNSDSKSNALSALGKAGSDKCASLMSVDQQSKMAEDVLQSLGKLTSDLTDSNAEKAFKEASELETKVALQSASSMVPGEAPKEIKVEGGTVQVTAIDPNKGGSIGGGINLPIGVGGAVVASTRKMRQTFSPSSSEVKGNTHSLSTSSGDGKKTVVRNLPEPVVLRMPTEGSIPSPPIYTAYKEMLPVVHMIPCTANSSVLILKLKPVYDNFTGEFFIFMEKGTTPSYVNHRWNCTLPNPEPPDFWNKTDSERDFYESETKWRCWFDNQQLNSTCIGRFFIGVVYKANLTDNFTATLAPTNIPISEAPSRKVAYYFYGYTRTCLYWDEDLAAWSGDGCTTSIETTDDVTVCHCTHLTEFGGGGLLAAPQPIDFSKAFAGFSNLGENPTVFAVVMALVGVYFMLLAWCRWKDKSDLIKIAIAPLEENHPNDTYFYEIAVQTGFRAGASTTADVFIIITGSLSETAPKKLSNPVRKCFQRGETDMFLLATPYDLGNLKEIEIWHNNAGVSPGWHLMQIQIKDVQSEKRYRFVCNKWLDVAEDDGLIQRKLQLAEKEELLDFSFVFAQTSRKNLFDGHIWFSVFTRPPQSTFTRCQRLNCCWSLLLTTMLSNAMFYTGGDPPTGDTIQIGPLAISIAQIKIGFTSSLVVIPVNLLIVTLFKKAGPRKVKSKGLSKREGLYSQTASDAVVEDESEKVDKKQSCIQFLSSICFHAKEDDGKKKKKQLPHWLIYIAYFFVFISSSASAFFVILYGFTFGKEKSDKWIVSMLVSLTQSILVIQPVKVIALSVLFAMLLRDPNKAEEDEEKTRIKGEIVERKKGEEESKANGKEAADELRKLKEQYSRPSEIKLQEARMQRLKEKQMKAVVREIVVHLLFLALCLLVAYAAMDPFAFNLADGTKSAVAKGGIMGSYVVNESDVIKAEEIAREEEWYDWVEKSVIPYLFLGSWYMDGFAYAEGFVADNEPSKVLALARVRQLRVKRNTCKAHPIFKHRIAECNDGYSWGSEDVGKYSARWNPPLNNSEKFALRKNKRKALWMGLETPWTYRSAIELKSFPFMGHYAVYGGGSFAANIGPNRDIATKILRNMKDNFWVDRYTRALFIEANIYNANTNLFLIVTLLHEITPTGGWSYFYNIQSLRLYRYNGGLGSIIMLIDFIFVIVTVVGIYRFGKSCYRHGCRQYFTDSWNIMHVVVTGLSVGAITTTLLRFLALKFAIDNYTADPEIFVSFAYVGQMEYFIMAFIGFVVFSTNLEFLRLLRFNKKISQLTTTLKSCMGALASFAVVFMTMFISFVSFAHLIYCESLEDFRTFPRSFVSMVIMFLGKFEVDQYIDNAPVFGPLLFFSYMIIIQMVLINFFVGIVCDAFVEIREESCGKDNEYEILSFLTNKFKRLSGDQEGLAFVPIYVEWKSDWEETIDRIAEQCDSAVYLLRNVESEEVRQEKWFSEADVKKRNLLLAILGLDYYDLDSEFCDSIAAIERRLRKMSVSESKAILAAAAKRRKKERYE